MIALEDLRKLPIDERKRLVGELWDSIAEDLSASPDSKGLIEEFRKRSANLKANPSSGFTWEQLEARILSRRG